MLRWLASWIFRLSDHLPLKQGLKPKYNTWERMLRFAFRSSSIKTRIETATAASVTSSGIAFQIIFH